MIKKATYLLLTLVLSKTSWSTHLVGGYTSYTYLTTNADGTFKYRLDLNLFRDCKPSSADFVKTIEIGIYKDAALQDLIQKVSISNPSINKVNPPGNTPCPFLLQNVCVEKGFFSTIINLPSINSGYHIVYQVCCRNTQVNLADNNGTTQGQTYYAFIPSPEKIINSSPRFSGVPVPYMCQNELSDFLLRAIDPDGDSLVYRYSRPYQGASVIDPNPSPPQFKPSQKGVNYANGFSENQPFGNSGSFSVNPRTGLTSLLSKNTGNFTVGIEVREFRNGVDLGNSTRLDLQVWVISCPKNQVPKISKPSIKEFEVDAGEEICLEFEATDPDNDYVTLSAAGNLLDGQNGFKGQKAKFKSNFGLGKATGELCWTPSCPSGALLNQARDTPYYFTVDALDNGCPPKRDGEVFSIKVKPFEGADSIFGPNIICGGSKAWYNIIRKEQNGGTVYWTADNGKINALKESSAQIKWDSLATKGRVAAVEINKYGCPGDTIYYEVDIRPQPKKPSIFGDDTVCLGSSNIYFTNADNALKSEWSVFGATNSKLVQDTLEVLFDRTGDGLISLFMSDNFGCKSNTATLPFNVRRKPEAKIIGPAVVCPNNKDYQYWAKDGITEANYLWISSGGISKINTSAPDSISVSWGSEGLGQLILLITDKYGCASDTSKLQIRKDYLLDAPLILGDTDVCQNETQAYQVLSSKNAWYIWATSGIQTQVNDSSAQISIKWPIVGKSDIAVTEQAFDTVNKKYCVSRVANLVVSVHPNPDAPKIIGRDTSCQFDSTRFQVDKNQVQKYFWRINGDSSNILGQQTPNIHIFWSDTGKFDLSAQAISVQGCKSEIVDTTIIIHPKPQTIFTRILPAYICHPDKELKKIVAKGFKHSTFMWGIKNGTIQKEDYDTIEVILSEQGDADVWTQETSSFGCIGDTIKTSTYYQDLRLKLDFVSVLLPDNQVEIQWRSENQNEVLNNNQEMYRAKNLGGFSKISTLDKSTTYQTDKGINTDNNIYSYYISTINLCNETVVSDTHSHVKGIVNKQDDQQNGEIDFTAYIGWNKGVKQYELFRKLPDKNYELFDVFLQNTKTTYNLGLAYYQQCFRVKSIANSPDTSISWSNEFCINFDPLVFIPNAFTPNESGELNQTFGAYIGAVKSFEIQIFNRWGEQIFFSKDKNFRWTGEYNKQPLPIGVYAYLAKYTDFYGKSYQKSGSIHLLR